MTPEQQATIAEIERLAREFSRFVDGIGFTDELDFARIKIEEAVLWARAGVEALGGSDD